MTILNEQRHSLNAVATMLSVHIATIWRWILSGVRGKKLKAVKIGGRRFIFERDLNAFLVAINDRDPDDDSDIVDRADAAGKLLDSRRVRSRREAQ